MTITCPDNSAIALASAAASLPAVTGTVPSAGSIPSPPGSGSGAGSNAEASAAASAGGRSGSGPDLSGPASSSDSGSGPGDTVGPAYGNAAIPTNGTADIGKPRGPVGLVPTGSGAPQSPAAGNGGGTTPVQNADVPIMTNSVALSGSFGAPIISGTSGITTMNASVAGPTETFMVESKNGAGTVFSGLGRTLWCLLVAALLT